MIIPREGDKVRLYLQLMDADVVNPETGRVDRNKMGPEKLMKVASKTFHPYSIRAEEYDWWTIYISKYSFRTCGAFVSNRDLQSGSV